MTRAEFLRELGKTKGALWKVESCGALRREDGAGNLKCPIHVVAYTRRGRYSADYYAAARSLGLSIAERDAIAAAADYADSNGGDPKLRRSMLRVLGLSESRS